MDSEQRRIQRAQAGDSKELPRLYESYRRELHLTAAAHIPNRYRRVIGLDDVVQEAFMGVERGFPRFEYRGKGSFRAWLTKIVRNQALQMLRNERRAKRDRERLLTASDLHRPGDSSVADFIDVVRPDNKTPSANLRAKELFQQLTAAWDQLTTLQKQAVRLRHFQKRSLEECAEIMGITQDAARGQCQRGLKLLRKKLSS